MRNLVFVLAVVFCCINNPVIANIINSGFETGDITGWTTHAETGVEVLSGLGPIMPTEGTYFACISNGPYNNMPMSALLSDFFALPQGAQTIEFDWNFLTAEDTPSENYNDFGAARVLLDYGLWVDAAYADTESSGFTTIQSGGVTTPVGSYFTKQLGWQHASFDVSGSPTGSQSNKFRTVSYDVGSHNSVDAAMLIDNIQIIVPEPATFLLLGLGGLVLRRKR